MYRQKVGVYVDVSNIFLNGGNKMRFDVLRNFACRDEGEPVRLNAYVAFDDTRARQDFAYRDRSVNFHSAIRDFGFKVIEKIVTWYRDEEGREVSKSNADLEMAVDTLLQSDNLDKVLLATGDGDFIQVVRALQNKGCRVEIVAFENISKNLKKEADLFISGYLIPNLLPVASLGESGSPYWGDQRVRGVCYSYYADKGFGFMRFLKRIDSNLWITDSRVEGSPYGTAFAHRNSFKSAFNEKELPSREIIFEFSLRPGEGEKLMATDIVRIYPE